MSVVTTVIIGAGHAALAMSRCLAERSIDHVLLERGEVAQSWRSERWDSLRLLTPNWQSRLPGFSYSGNDPDGYRTLPEVVDFIAGYAKTISAPVRTHTTVTAVRGDDAGYLDAIPGDDDGMLSIATMRLAGASDFLRVECLHQLMPRDDAVRAATHCFLKNGYFVTADSRQPVTAEVKTPPSAAP